MKPNETNDADERVFVTGTSISEAGSWYTSLVKQLREIQEARRNPKPPVQITATPDRSALDKLVEPPSAFKSLIAGLRDSINDSLHPHKIETTATPVEVEEIWSKPKNGMPSMVSVGLHVLIVVIALIPWATAAKVPPPQATNVMLIQPSSLILNLPKTADTSG